MRLLLLDWDGVFECAGTQTHRPNGRRDWIDPIAVWHANVFIDMGYKIVISSTRRKDNEFRSPYTASLFMGERGFNIAPSDFFPAWRTDNFVGPRAEELARYFEQNAIELTPFIVSLDDEDVQTEQFPNAGLTHIRTDAQNGWTMQSTLQFVDHMRAQHGAKF